MKKKTAAIWLSAVLCAAMLAGCGNAKGNDSGTQTEAAAQAGEAIPEEETAAAQNEESGNDTGRNEETEEAAHHGRLAIQRRTAPDRQGQRRRTTVQETAPGTKRRHWRQAATKLPTLKKQL